MDDVDDSMSRFFEAEALRLVHASECDLPALDGVIRLLEERFARALEGDDYRRRKAGGLIADVMREHGWEPHKSGVRLRKGRSRFFKVATTYRKKKP